MVGELLSRLMQTLCSGTDLQDTACLDGARMIVRQREEGWRTDLLMLST
jgi:hypothetical protein